MDKNFEEAKSRIENVIENGLTHLDLSGLGLNTIPDRLWECTYITQLSLNKNKLSIIPDEIKNLSRLRLLHLEDNHLTTLPDGFGELSNLEVLFLRKNHIQSIPNSFVNLTKLKELHLGLNKLAKFPQQFLQLKNIEYLYITANQITEIPSEIINLKKIKYLGLRYNKLTRLPKSIIQVKTLYGKHTKSKLGKPRIDLSDNPLVSPPIEIAVNGLDSIKQYFDSLDKAEEITHLYEAKLIIVGEGEVGKTSLAKTITNPKYKLSKEERTEGIDVIDWNFEISGFEHSDFVNLHLWDFGGQEIYHSTHQFFLTTRSVYLFVLNPRREENVNTYYYWLNIIKLLGGNSPVIVVINKSDLYQREFTLEEFKIFNDKVVALVKTSCETKQGIDELKQEIAKCLRNLDHLGTPLDKRWLEIRDKLESIKNTERRDFINLVEYEAICRNFGLDKEDIKRLSDIFHALGIFIHYQDDIRLQNIIILNPEWATQGVYKILDNEKVKEKNGNFTNSDLDLIWIDEQFRYYKSELLALMKKFELCFEVKSNAEYLAPQLLSKQIIHFEWNKKQNLHFEYIYDFMPKGILSHFIVKQNEDVLDNLFWLNGVVLQWNETKAIVTEHYIEKKIRIILEGSEKKHFLAIIRKTIQDIHKRFHNLKFSESVGCTCVECSKSETPFLHRISTIKNAQRKNIKELQCQKSFDDVSLPTLLNLIEELKDEEGLQGTFFESIIKTLLQHIYSDASIQQSVIIDGYEFDFIVISPSQKEIIIVEAKGYKSKQKITLGEFDAQKNKYEKQTVNWFFRHTFTKAQSNLSNLLSSPLYQNFRIKACYIASCSFETDAISFLESLQSSSLKPTQLNLYYDRIELTKILEIKGLKQQLQELNRYYS